MDIFSLVDEHGRLFPPLVQAAILAKYCRSAESARELMRGIDEAMAAAFQEKWVIGFGHASVADMAVIPVCFEGVSIVASKMLERMQRPAAAEKSTRVVKFGRESFVPDRLDLGMPDSLKQLAYESYDLYDSLVEQVGNQFASLGSMKSLDIARATFDVCRGLLPAGTATNLGLVANALDLSRLIADLSASPNQEFQTIANQLRGAIGQIGGPLIRHTEPNRWLQRWESPSVSFRRAPAGIPEVCLLNAPTAWEVEHLLDLAKEALGVDDLGLEKFMEERPEHCELPRYFELADFDFNVVMDYGAYRDLQRHRRCTQLPAPLTAKIGYVVPDPIQGTPAGQQFEALMRKFQDYPWRGGENGWTEQYAIPLAFLHSTYFRLDARELYYIVELRTPKAGRHIAYRRIAWELFDKANRASPWLMKWCRAVDPSKD